MRRVSLLFSAAAVWLLPAGLALAQQVSLQGMLGSKALLVIDGGRPRALAPGEAAQGVKVIATTGDTAVVQTAGQRFTLRVGETPVNLGGPGTPGHGRRIVLTADSRGHFVTQGSINNRPVQFMVDTGATTVALGQAEADRLGLDYRRGRPVMMHTANGATRGWLLKVQALRVGDVTAHDVDTVVVPLPMPAALLGNSFLNQFNMRREGSLMTLERR
ncbi:MAG: TIGR02281 family clan AA aspartic protease [Comamonadaceae bacterium]|nr:TIGR02281 family clan AA aspartic protease [Comamonadaceae bacterium]